MTAQLSRERLEEKLLEHIKHGGDSEEETMVRMLLSGMDSEPVAWIVHARQGDMLTSDGDFVANAEGISSIRSTPLYTAPPAPAPVAVPDELTREEYKRRFMEKYDFDDTYRGGWNACRAAMLKAEPVMPAAVADQTAAKEKLLELLQRGIDFQSADIPVNATSAPMQPLEFDDRGTLRFKENKIVRRLLDYSKQRGYGLNEIALEDFTDDDRMQLAQLIGYSLSGYGELSYVSDESWERAAAATPEKEE
jgi:hypothetical protein